MRAPFFRLYYGPAFRAAQIERRTLHVPAALGAFDGKTLLFMSDLHMSDMFPEAAMERLLAQAGALRPDVLLIGGDLAETEAYQARAVEMLGKLRPELGTFAVVGNNDGKRLKRRGAVLPAALRRAGITPLIDAEASVETPGGRLIVAGLNALIERTRVRVTFFADSGEGDLRILMAHYPKSLTQYSGRCAKPPHLALAGHTHGGQFRFLGLTPYSIGFELSKTDRGLPVHGWTDIPGFPLLVSPGVGTSRIPFRLNVPPTVHLITIRAGA
ncbi:MAG: metallophosphoesterase [Clostridia bacterium]|nr:metallophosphoesterase [Clostridia bacterium]